MTDASDFCWWQTNSIDCQRKAAIEAEPYYPLMYSEGEETKANVTYLMVSTVQLAAVAMMAFRFRSSD